MILLDLQQSIIASFMAALRSGPRGSPGSVDVDVGLFRHIAVNLIKNVNVKFKKDYGELVLAVDSREVWRRGVFPYYKANRKKARDDSVVDWNKLFAALDVVKDEVRDNLPYRFVKVDGCEADDVIGVLAGVASDPTLVVSGDFDFVQLHRFAPPIRQWDHVRKREIPYDQHALVRKIIRGDSGDGVPNFLSDDDTLVTPGKRQKPITQVNEDRWVDMTPEEVWASTKDPVSAERNWKRNQKLVDLKETPPDLVKQILDKYAEVPKSDRMTVYSYLARSGLRKLLEDLQDF